MSKQGLFQKLIPLKSDRSTKGRFSSNGDLCMSPWQIYRDQKIFLNSLNMHRSGLIRSKWDFFTKVTLKTRSRSLSELLWEKILCIKSFLTAENDFLTLIRLYFVVTWEKLQYFSYNTQDGLKHEITTDFCHSNQSPSSIRLFRIRKQCSKGR